MIRRGRWKTVATKPGTCPMCGGAIVTGVQMQIVLTPNGWAHVECDEEVTP